MTMGGRPCTRRHAPAFRTPCAPNGLAPANTYPSSACHCEPVRTLVWQSASPQRGLASWLLFWQIRSTFRIRLKYCSLLCAAARRTDCPVASLLAIITCFHTTINENVIYWRYGRSLMSYPRSGRRILQPFQFGKEDQLLSEKTTKSRLAPPNICYGLRHNPAEKTRPGSGSIACALFRKVPTLFS